MRILKTLFLTLAFSALGAFAQDIPVDEMPIATLDDNFHLTLDSSQPISDYYRVDISHLAFENEADAIRKCRIHLTGNLISNEVNFTENYVVVQIHTEYMGDSYTHERMATYLNQLTKPE